MAENNIDTEEKQERQNKRRGRGIPIRKNVLILMGAAYGSLIAIFVIMISAGLEPKAAYDLIGVPFVALIGGTLAVAKDLLE